MTSSSGDDDIINGRVDHGEFVTDLVVTRDHNFRELYADTAVAVKSTRNLDLSLLRMESAVTDCYVEEGTSLPSRFSFSPKIREIGRVVLPRPIAYSLAMDILEELADSGSINANGFEKRMAAIISAVRHSYDERKRGISTSE